jgi:hypothetical protein
MPNGGKRPGAGRKPDLKKQAIAEAYTKALYEAVQKEKLPLIQALIAKAKTGDIAALKEIHERLLGKVKDEMSLTGDLNLTSDVSDEIYKAILTRESQRADIKVSGG